MQMWKILSSIVSMFAAALVLSSSVRVLRSGDIIPPGLLLLTLAGLCLGVAGIIQLVFRDGGSDKLRITVFGLYLASGIFFVLTIIRATFDTEAWIQIITFTVWALGCAFFEYLDLVWSGVLKGISSKRTEKNHDTDDDEGGDEDEPHDVESVEAEDSVTDDDDSDEEEKGPSPADIIDSLLADAPHDNKSASKNTDADRDKGESADILADLPPIPDVDAEIPLAGDNSAPPRLPTEWDGHSMPPRLG